MVDGFIYILSTSRLIRRPRATPWLINNNIQKHLSLKSVFYFEASMSSPVFVNMFSFNLGDPYARQSNMISLIIENAHQIYMSEKSIYLTFTRYLNRSRSTVIHKVFVQDGYMIPFADGVVSGSVNNQFSMDEHAGVLRIATTEGFSDSNNVFCLDHMLEIVGELRGIAPNERIFSARYVDTRLYMVTFRQIDPFFVINLTDHTQPEVLGELKITGFSRYLHPYD